MCYIFGICFMCLKNHNDLINVAQKTEENATVDQVKYILPELNISELGTHPLYICSSCHSALQTFYTFKKMCLENYDQFKNCMILLPGSSDTQFSELKINICKSERLTPLKQEIVVELNVQEDNKDSISIKEETITSDDNADRAFYQQLVKFSISDNEQNSGEDVIQLNKDESDFSTHTVNDYTNSICSKILENSDLSDKGTISNGNVKFKCLDCDKQLTCDICNKKFIEKCALHKHTKIHKKFRQNCTCKSLKSIKHYVCSICNKKFAAKCNLQRHMNIHKGRDHKCLICNKKFTEKGNLQQHMELHKDIKDHECSICNKKFTEKCLLQNHMKSHEGIRDQQCSICNKKFTEKGHLQAHMKIHEGIRDHECSICNKKFKSKVSLHIHKLEHKDRVYECSICNEKFTRRSNFKKHNRKHGRVIDYECLICNKKFTQRGRLNSHMKYHKVYKCSICNEKFTRNSNFKKHFQIHENIRDYECSICKEKFTKKDSLQRHMKIHEDRKQIYMKINRAVKE